MAKINGKQIETTVLTGIVAALAVFHNAGVKAGHFGNTDFLEIGEEIAGGLLSQLVSGPAATAEPVATAVPVPVSGN